jgi:glucuronoarabinoxylan endo-1,4-beta-xylanase
MIQVRLKIAILLCVVILMQVIAQTSTVTLSSEKQTIRGFGGMNCPTWGAGLTTDQVTTAYGNGSGQIGMTIFRIMVNDNSSAWTNEVSAAQKAVSLGAIVFASPWNPPSSLCETVNGQKKLKTSSYSVYTDHLNSFITYMKGKGIDLYAISVQNEPDYASEWTAWAASDILTFMKQNASSLQTKVIAPESYQFVKTMSDPILNDSTALANMDILGAHLYGTSISNYSYPLFQQKGTGKELWMTEHYTDSKNDADLWPLALGVATEIHHALVTGQFNAYVWWYVIRSYGMLKTSGAVSKRGYCMAQFSKFVRPGFVRVDATAAPTPGVWVSAYKSDTSVVIVAIDTTTSSKTITFSIPGTTVSSLKKYTTSSSKSLSDDGTATVSSGSFTGTLDAQSVSTWVGKYTTGIINPDSKNKTGNIPNATIKLTECKVYDLRGRQVNTNRINEFKNSRMTPNDCVYIVRDNKTGNVRYININK